MNGFNREMTSRPDKPQNFNGGRGKKVNCWWNCGIRLSLEHMDHHVRLECPRRNMGNQFAEKYNSAELVNLRHPNGKPVETDEEKIYEEQRKAEKARDQRKEKIARRNVKEFLTSRKSLDSLEKKDN